MGKSLIQQKRGKGSPRYRARSFYYMAQAKLPKIAQATISATIRDIVKCPGHYAPLLELNLGNGEECFIIAPEGVRVGETIQIGENAEVKTGNILPLKSIPEGTIINSIESHPGDGGKFVRSSGGFAKITAKMANKVMVLLPSKKEKEFNPDCRAVIGVIAGAGRPEKPLMKAGTRWFKMVPRNKLWPKISGTSQNAVNHPLGGSRSSKKGIPTVAPKNAPPGRKVGKIRPRRTGRRKR